MGPKGHPELETTLARAHFGIETACQAYLVKFPRSQECGVLKTSVNKPNQWRQRFRKFFFGMQNLRQGNGAAMRSITGGRKHNEDRCYSNHQDQFYLVADGMGGYKGGALASQIAVETIPELMRDLVACQIRGDRLLNHAFRSAVDTAHLEMSQIAAEHREYAQMGCTLAAAFVIADRLYYANIGDCRVYLLRGNRLIQLSHDESMVQNLIDMKIITKSQAATHRLRHVVTNSISAHGVQITPRLDSIRIDSDDTVLLTTDGLVNEMSDSEIADVLLGRDDVDSAVSELVKLADQREARDNVSCVVFRPNQTHESLIAG